MTKRFKVTFTVFAGGGGEMDITANDESDAMAKVKKLITDEFNPESEEWKDLWDKYGFSLNEVCPDHVETIGEPAPVNDPSLYEWVRMGEAKHPLPEGTLIFSRNGETDNDENDIERETGPNVVGVIDHTHFAGASQEWAYGCLFQPSGVYVTIDANEYYCKIPNHHHTPDDYLIAI